jgi:Kef-type K+ transport system membrane component KefB
MSLSLCFVLAWLAAAIGLAPIIGAFAAGLILEDTHVRDFASRGERTIGELLRPLSDFLVPVFFVLMGLRTDLRAFAEPGVLVLAGCLTTVAIIGKQACSLGVLTRGADRLSVGIGMVPRGEVGLIFANVGLGLAIHGQPILSRAMFSAVVAMVVVTTMITPPALKWSLERKRPKAAGH